MIKLRDLLNKIPTDKKEHIIAGLIIGMAFGTHIELAIFITIFIGAGKEILDLILNKIGNKASHDASLLDMAATFIGGATGIIIVQNIIHFLK